MRKGLFITIEGGEGCGKSTHTRLLKNYINRKGFKTVVTREPGGTIFGKNVRDILLKSNVPLQKTTELLLFAADRAEHVASLIRPSLKKGKIVICDRFIDSTTAYQEAGRGLPKNVVGFINNVSSFGLKPDITILLDIPPKVGLKRLRGGPNDRFERSTMNFHKTVRRKFLELAGKEKARIKVVDSSMALDKVQEKIRSIIVPYLKKVR